MELKLRNLTKKYGNFTALSQLSVTFTPINRGNTLERPRNSISREKISESVGFHASTTRLLRSYDRRFFSPLSFSVERNSKKAGRPRNQNSSSKDQSL